MLLTWDDQQQLQNCRLTWPIFLESVIMLCKSSYSLFGKSTVPTCCFSPAGLSSLLAIAWVPSFLADTGVLSQPVGEACQSPGAHWKLSAATVPQGNLIYSHFSPLFHRPSLLWHLAKHRVFTLRKGCSLVCKDPPWSSSEVVMMPVHLGIVMTFSGTLTCVFLIKIMICQHSWQRGLRWCKGVLLLFKETLPKAPFPWLSKALAGDDR